MRRASTFFLLTCKVRVQPFPPGNSNEKYQLPDLLSAVSFRDNSPSDALAISFLNTTATKALLFADGTSSSSALSQTALRRKRPY